MVVVFVKLDIYIYEPNITNLVSSNIYCVIGSHVYYALLVQSMNSMTRIVRIVQCLLELCKGCVD